MNNIISQPLSFDNTNIRSTIQDGVTYYSVIDVIGALIKDDSLINQSPSSYWSKLQNRKLNQFGPIWQKLKIEGIDGKKYQTDVSTREQMFEIITYIPSKKVAPFRKWLAGLAESEFKKIESGENSSWHKVRDKSKKVRKGLTCDLIEHGVEGSQIGEITNTYYRYGFGKTASSYRDHKGLTTQNLRDHMTPTELQITSTMETILPQVMDNHNSFGFNMVKVDAMEVGEFGAKMIREIERLTGSPVVSKENNLSPKKKLDTKKDKQLVIE